MRMHDFMRNRKLTKTDYGVFFHAGGMIPYTVGMLSLKSNEYLGFILVIIGFVITTIGLCLAYQKREDNGKAH